MERLDKIAISLGAATRVTFEQLGAMALMLLRVLVSRPRYHILMEQVVRIGIASLPIVLLASILTGFIATWQVKYLAGDYMGLSYLGFMVLKTVTSDLGPILIGLVLAGRIGAKVAAEVGTMRVNEQIDALTCLSLPPMNYLISPRVIAGFFMGPVLFVFGAVAAIISSQVLATAALGLHPFTFYNSMHIMFDIQNVYMGLAKSFVFNGITALCGCYFGYNTVGGAVGVGTSTRRAVVNAVILILIANMIVSKILI